MKPKKIIVTGGSGLIGLEICKQLAGAGHKVHMFDLGEQIGRVKDAIPKDIKIFYGSILDLASLREAMSGCEIVIHLAALLGVRRSERDKLRCLEINIDGTKNVLDCAIQHRLKKIVFSSSSEVYGEPLENPITEKTVTQGKTVYAVTKLAGEELCKAYAQKYPIKYAIARYFNCYGSYQTGQFILSRFVSNLMKGRPPEVYGDGKQIRSYTYVEDTARATILAAFNSKANGEVLNIGSGNNPISNKDLAHLVIELAGKKGDIKPVMHHGFKNTDRKKEREIFERYCDSSKAQKLLAWRPQVSLRQGIKKVFETGVIFDRWSNLYDEDI